MINITINVTSVGFKRCDAFILALGSRGSQWGSVKIMCLSIYISFWSYVSPFGDHKSAAHNCAHIMQLQGMC